MKRLKRVYTPTVEERVEWHLEDGTDTLYVCPDAWALRYQFIRRETGEVRRAQCDHWTCLYCGPRKVDMWRQVIAEAELTLHIVLTKAGKTMEQEGIERQTSQKLSLEQREEAFRLLDEGISLRQVARHFGVNPESLRRLVMRHKPS